MVAILTQSHKALSSSHLKKKKTILNQIQKYS